MDTHFFFRNKEASPPPARHRRTGIVLLVLAAALLTVLLTAWAMRPLIERDICNKLCYYNYIDDVFVACWNYGWNTCRKCLGINFDTVFW